VKNQGLIQQKEGLGIFAKLLFGLIFILAVTGIGDIYSYSQMNRLSDLTARIFNHPLRVTTAVLSADTAIVKIHRSMKDVALSSTETELEAAIIAVKTYENEVFENLGIAEKWILGDEGALLLAETVKLFQDWESIREEVISLTKSGNRAHAIDITRGKGAAHVEALNSKMRNLKNYAAVNASAMLIESRVTKNTILKTTAITFLGVILVAGLFGYLSTRTLNDSIKKLISGVAEFSRMNLNHQVTVKSRDEIGWLANAFNQMSQQLKKSIEDLNLQSEIVANMTEGVFLVRVEDGIIVYANPKMEAMFGYDAEEMNGKHISVVNAPTDKHPEETANEIMRVVIETGVWQGEIKNVKKDATIFWCYANVSAFEYSKYGKVLVSVHTDITKRKRLESQLKQNHLHLEETVKKRTIDLEREISERKIAEEQIKANLAEKETLLKEVHHRVKNNLAVVSGLLMLQANKTDDERLIEALNVCQTRVQSMSVIHEILYQSENFSAVDLNGYLSKLASDVTQNYSIGSNVHLKIEASNLMIGINQASPLGLIVNELITNSLKYAFPKGRKGEIVLKLESNKENEVELVISDNGVGMPGDFDLHTVNSLGLKLVKAIAENQLDGSVEMINKNGTKFTIKFKIAEV